MRNIFVIGLDDYGLEMLQTIRGAENYAFHRLLEHERVVGAPTYPMEELLREAREGLDASPGPVDAIVGHYDFPTSTMMPILRSERRLPTPSLESVLRCEHKYWSRVEQRAVLGEETPGYCAVDPFARDPLAGVTLRYPFWLKPVKSFSSYLGFRIGNRRDFSRAIEQIRAGIQRLAEPFNFFLERAELPPEIAAVDGYHCIAEELVSGRQCTLEGYVLGGEVRIYGVIDTKREPNRSSFSRFEYPSTLPRPAVDQMLDQAHRVLGRIGLDETPFNVEFYYDDRSQRVRLLEINPRNSKSHSPLFHMVEGASHDEVMVEVALGREPDFPRSEGRYRRAAKFMARKYGDATVTHAPSAREVAEVAGRIPGVRISLQVDAGTRLSELPDQDSYSYAVGEIFVGANSQRELLRKYREVMEALPLRFSDGGTVRLPRVGGAAREAPAAEESAA